MLNCLEATRLISIRQDRPLTAAEVVRLRFHLLICAGCRRCSQQFSWLDHQAAVYAHRADQGSAGDDLQRTEENHPD